MCTELESIHCSVRPTDARMMGSLWRKVDPQWTSNPGGAQARLRTCKASWHCQQIWMFRRKERGIKLLVRSIVQGMITSFAESCSSVVDERTLCSAVIRLPFPKARRNATLVLFTTKVPKQSVMFTASWFPNVAVFKCLASFVITCTR